MANLYTCSQIAERYHVKPATVWGWIRKKKLPAQKSASSTLSEKKNFTGLRKARSWRKTGFLLGMAAGITFFR